MTEERAEYTAEDRISNVAEAVNDMGNELTDMTGQLMTMTGRLDAQALLQTTMIRRITALEQAQPASGLPPTVPEGVDCGELWRLAKEVERTDRPGMQVQAYLTAKTAMLAYVREHSS